MTNIINLDNDNYTAKRRYNQCVSGIMDGYHAHIPHGDYDATLTDWYTANICGVPKVVLLFSIVDSGEYFETVVARFYAVKRIKGKQGINGGFVSKARGAFAEDYYTMNPTAPRLRPDRVPMTKLQGKIFTITVGDVTTNHKQKEHGDRMKYSVVRKIKLN